MVDEKKRRLLVSEEAVSLFGFQGAESAQARFLEKEKGAKFFCILSFSKESMRL